MFKWLKCGLSGTWRNLTLARAVSPVIEQIEPRVLLAASCSVSGTIMTITGSSVAELVTVELSGTNMLVKDNGSTLSACSVAASGIARINAALAGGNDSISIADGIGSTYLINASISGGDGNDTLEGTDLNDTIYDSNGDDFISGDDGADSIDADAGNDSVSGGPGDDSIRGGEGNDSLYGDDGYDHFWGHDNGTYSDYLYGGLGQNFLEDGDQQPYDTYEAGVCYNHDPCTPCCWECK